jgi:hypothetical protein
LFSTKAGDTSTYVPGIINRYPSNVISRPSESDEPPHQVSKPIHKIHNAYITRRFIGRKDTKLLLRYQKQVQQQII